MASAANGGSRASRSSRENENLVSAGGSHIVKGDLLITPELVYLVEESNLPDINGAPVNEIMDSCVRNGLFMDPEAMMSAINAADQAGDDEGKRADP